MVVNVNSKTFSFKLIPILVLINFSEPISHTKCFTLKDVLIIINYCDLLYWVYENLHILQRFLQFAQLNFETRLIRKLIPSHYIL